MMDGQSALLGIMWIRTLYFLWCFLGSGQCGVTRKGKQTKMSEGWVGILLGWRAAIYGDCQNR